MDNVTFNDNNNGNYNVELDSNVTPTSVTVDTTGTYTISGGGGDQCVRVRWTKLNTGTLVLGLFGTSTYSGGTFVQNWDAATGIELVSTVGWRR